MLVPSALLLAACTGESPPEVPTPVAPPAGDVAAAPPVVEAPAPPPPETEPPTECPPLIRGEPGAVPVIETIDLGGRSLTLARCPSGVGGTGAPADVAWWKLDGTELGGRLMPHHNWDGGGTGEERPELGSVDVTAQGPLSDGAWAVVLYRGDYGWGRGDREAWIVPPAGTPTGNRDFPGRGRTWVEDGTLRAEDADPSESAHDVAALDAQWRWQPPDWVPDGPPRLRTELDVWPCETVAVPILDPGTGAPTGGALRVEREMALEALEFRADVGGQPLFLVQAGAARGWVRQITQSCAG